MRLEINYRRDFPGGPVVKTLHFQCRGCGFHPWSGKLRSHMPHDTAKRKEENQLQEKNC